MAIKPISNDSVSVYNTNGAFWSLPVRSSSHSFKFAKNAGKRRNRESERFRIAQSSSLRESVRNSPLIWVPVDAPVTTIVESKVDGWSASMREGLLEVHQRRTRLRRGVGQGPRKYLSWSCWGTSETARVGLATNVSKLLTLSLWITHTHIPEEVTTCLRKKYKERKNIGACLLGWLESIKNLYAKLG